MKKFFSTGRGSKGRAYIKAHIVNSPPQTSVADIISMANELIADYPELTYDRMSFGRALWYKHAVSAMVSTPKEGYQNLREVFK